MVWLGLLVLVMLLLLLRQSLVLVLAVATAYVHVFVANSKIEFLIQDFWFTVDREVLLSVPLFMLAGNVMSRGSIAKRLINFMSAFTAPIPGGLAVACVLACGAFAAINGSSIVTMLAIGTIMYPALVARGYSQSFSIGAIASAGTLGIIMPPSIPLILYGIMTEENIAHLFVAGIGPGLLLMTMFAVYSFWVNRHIRARPSAWPSRQATHGGIFAILPALIDDRRHLHRLVQPHRGRCGVAGLCAADRVFRACRDGAKPAPSGAAFSERVRHYLATREMGIRTLIDVILETTKLLATLLPLLCIAGSLNTILDHSGVPRQMVQSLSEAITSPTLMMLGMNILLLIVGCLMDVGSAILILAPLLKPLAVAIGVDPVHFGIIMISNLEIGYLTPPVGLNLIVAMAAFKVAFGTIVKSVVPFITIMLFWLVMRDGAIPTLSVGLLGR